jgi:hypothetical protein
MSPESLEDRYLLSLRFAPAVTFPVGLRPESVVTADLGNGHQDIAVLNQGQFPDHISSVSVLLGNGDGTFQPPTTTSVLAGATSLAVGDFHGDGKPDLAIVSGLNNSVEILRGNGDGTFQSNPLIIPVGTQGFFGPDIESVAVGDFAHNGTLDLAVANPGDNTVSVLLGNGDGTFHNRVDLPVGTAPVSVVAADLGNGQVDLVVADAESSAVSVLLGNGDGTFQPAQNIDVNFPLGGLNSAPLTLRVGDFNGDGNPDILINQFFLGQDVGETVLTLLPGDGHGGFQAPSTLPAGIDLSGLAVGDFNGDGKLGFATAEGLGAGAVVFSGNGDGTFAAPVAVPSGGFNPFGLATADFQGDGLADLVVANTFSNTVAVLLNTANAASAAPTTTTLDTTVTSPVFGQDQTLTATVTSTAGTPTGPVTFFDGTTRLGQASLNAAGQATLTVSLGVGTHSLTATFGGNKTFAGSTSAPLAETVSRADTVLALSPSTNPVGQGRPVTFTATVTTVAPGSGTPHGIVTFFQGNTVLAAPAVDANGQASLTTTFSILGDVPIRAVFNGFGLFAGSSQTITEQVVAPAPTAVVLIPSVESGVAGVPVTFTVTVSPVAPGAGTPTGTVTLFDGATVLGTAQLDANGQAVFTFAFAAGDHRLTVSYGGDANFQAGLSDALDFPVV